MFHVNSRPFTGDFAAQNSSPLAERDPNACPRFSIQMASVRKLGEEGSAYSYKRALNPLLQRKSDDEQDRRRRVFLNRVRQAGDERKWELRSEQVRRYDSYHYFLLMSNRS